MKRQYPIQIYAIYKNQIPKISFVQHDTEVNRLYFEFFEDIDVPMTDIITATLTVKRFDENSYTYGMSDNNRPVFIIEGNLVTVIFPPSAVYTVGECSASVSLYDSDMGRLTTQTFKYTVTQELIGETPIDETNDYPVLTDLIRKTENLKTTYEAAVDGSAESQALIEVLNAKKEFPTLEDKIDNVDLQLKDNVVNILFPPIPLLPATGTKTEVTASINAIANFCRLNNKDMHIPSATFLINGTLDFSNLTVTGDGVNSKIILDNTQVDVIKIDGNSLLENFYIHGGWDGTTAGQLGNGITVENTINNTPFNVHFKNLKIQYIKENFIKIVRGGYSSIQSVKCNASGKDGLVLYGIDGASSITTINVDGESTFSDVPNGYGISITNGINININSCICEYSKGVLINGNDNRSINITGMYQENTSGGKFATLQGGCQNLNIIGCFGVGTSIDYNLNYPGTNIIGCTGLTLPTQAYTWNMVQTNGKTYVPKMEVFQEFTTGANFEPWQYGHPIVCGYHLWIDAQGRLRIKATAPTSDTDGTVVGTQA